MCRQIPFQLRFWCSLACTKLRILVQHRFFALSCSPSIVCCRCKCRCKPLSDRCWSNNRGRSLDRRCGSLRDTVSNNRHRTTVNRNRCHSSICLYRNDCPACRAGISIRPNAVWTTGRRTIPRCILCRRSKSHFHTDRHSRIRRCRWRPDCPGSCTFRPRRNWCRTGKRWNLNTPSCFPLFDRRNRFCSFPCSADNLTAGTNRFCACTIVRKCRMCSISTRLP